MDPSMCSAHAETRRTRPTGRWGPELVPGHSHPPSRGRAWDPEHPPSRILGRAPLSAHRPPPPLAWHPGHLALACSQAHSLPAHPAQGPAGRQVPLGSSRQARPAWGLLCSPPAAPDGCGPGIFLRGTDACSAPRTLLSRPRVTKPPRGHPGVAPVGPLCPALGGLRAGTNGGPDGRCKPTPFTGGRQTCAFRRARCQLAGEPRGSGWGLAHTASRQGWPGPLLTRCYAHGVTISPGGPRSAWGSHPTRQGAEQQARGQACILGEPGL